MFTILQLPPVRAMQQVEYLIYRDFLPKDRGKSGHGWPIGARNQMLNRSIGTADYLTGFEVGTVSDGNAELIRVSLIIFNNNEEIFHWLNMFLQ